MNKAGIELIKEFEGLRLKAYRCSANVWTLGFGYTKGVKEGDTCTIEQAEEWLLEDIAEAESAVDQYVDVPLTGNQFAALVSFVYNVGAGNFKKSTLLRLLNKGWYQEAAAQFLRWNKAGGEVLGGLARRRAAEVALFNKKENENGMVGSET